MSISIDRTYLTSAQLEFVKQAMIGKIARQTEHGLSNEVFCNKELKKQSDDIRMQVLPLYEAFNGGAYGTNFMQLGLYGVPRKMVRWFTRVISNKELLLVVDCLEEEIKKWMEHDEVDREMNIPPLQELVGVFATALLEDDALIQQRMASLAKSIKEG